MKENEQGLYFYPVKLIAGILYPDQDWWDWTVKELEGLWGSWEIISPPYTFNVTDYYREISPVLFRRFISFTGIRDGAGLPRWKKESCRVEERSRSPRAVNIDPGYVNGARLVLASTKDHAHRIYLGEGIHAEVTLRFRFKKWQAFDYTFPDFAAGIYDEFLSAAREQWIKETQSRRSGG